MDASDSLVEVHRFLGKEFVSLDDYRRLSAEVAATRSARQPPEVAWWQHAVATNMIRDGADGVALIQEACPPARSTSGPSEPTLICQRCKVDRYKAACPETRPQACPMVGDARGPE